MTAYEIQQVANLVAKIVYNMLVEDEKFAKRINKSMPKKKRMLNTRQTSELLGISAYQVRKIANKLGAVKANAKGDSDGKKRYGHLAFVEDGLVERYQEYLRTK